MKGPDAPDPAGGKASGAHIPKAGRHVGDRKNRPDAASVKPPDPYFVRVGKDKCAGMVRPLACGLPALNWTTTLFEAVNRFGVIGCYSTAVEAERAIINDAREAKP
jgi:hypothetical protein